MTRASRLRRRGPKSTLETILTWKKGVFSTERLAIVMIVVLIYVNTQMLMAIYAGDELEQQEILGPRINLLNPVAEREAGLANKDTQNAAAPALEIPDRKLSESVSGDSISVSLCPTQVTCPPGHLHIYAEGGPRKPRICLNGKDVLPVHKSGRGLNMVVINPNRATAGNPYFFDTYANSGVDMVDVLANLNDNRLVVMVSNDDASLSLGSEGKRAIEKIGSTLIRNIGYRESWAFVGQVGISTISEYEVTREKLNDWADPVALSRCIPKQLDESTLMSEMRQDFCDEHDNYGSFCKGSWVRPTPSLAVRDAETMHYPIAIIAGDRGHYVRRVLDSLFAVPGVYPQNIIIFQDGYNLDTFEVVRQFGVRTVRFPKTSSDFHSEDTFNHADHISTSYERSLKLLWKMFPVSEFAFILEDDLMVGPDFLDYFQQLLPILRADKTLCCASAWNDNGYMHASKDPTMVYRTEFFPGLGWILPRKRWEEVIGPAWPKCCYGASWDLHLRGVLNSHGLDVLYPDISRTYHIGKVGANVGADFFNGFFREKVVTDKTHYQLAGLNQLGPQEYDSLVSKLISQATPVDHAVDPCEQHFITVGEDLLVLYYYQRDSRETRQAMAVAGCLHIWNVDKIRGMFNNVLRMHYRGNTLLLVGSMTKYAKKYMPEGLEPIRVVYYKDEIEERKAKEEKEKKVEV